MRVQYRRCDHCRTKYLYTSSGRCDTKYNDSKYCPDCKKVVLDTLKTIPIKFEEVFVPTDEITYEDLIRQHDIEQKRLEKEDAKAGRFRIPLYPVMWTGDPDDTFEWYYVNGNEYRVHSNKAKNIEHQIEVKKEKNLLTGECKKYWF
jgi:glutaredoxin